MEEKPRRSDRAMQSGGDRVALASFIIGSLIAGGNAVGVRFSNRELAPLWGAGFRFSVAAVLLLAVMVAMRLAIPRGRALIGAVVFGVFNFAASFALAYYGLVRVHAGLGQTLLALVPLLTLLLAVAHRQERFRVGSLAGTLLALIGIAVISRTPLQGSVPLLSLLAIVGGALCFAEAAVLVRWFPPVHPVTMNAVGMTVGAILLVLGSLVAGDPHVLPERAATRVAFAYLVVSSALIFVLYIVVLRHWPASRAAYVFVLTPVVTVLLSSWLDDEPIGAGLVLGGLLVIAGVYVGALRPATPAPAPAEAEVVARGQDGTEG